MTDSGITPSVGIPLPAGGVFRGPGPLAAMAGAMGSVKRRDVPPPPRPHTSLVPPAVACEGHTIGRPAEPDSRGGPHNQPTRGV